MKLGQIRQTLAAEGILLSKSLGQNFLHDANQLARIVGAAELSDSDRVLEIGPGLGSLTQLLVENGAQVLAIEKDRRLAHCLKHRLGADRKLTLVHTDALDYLRRQPQDWSGWKLVSNLPYSVASAILVELARLRHPPDRIVVTVQLEVAQRLMASVATQEYGILTLLVQFTYKPHALFRIPPSCFFPAPRVDSACVTLVRRTTPLLPLDHRSIFDKLIKRGFSQRRKMMFKLLRTDWPAEVLDTAFAEIGVDPQIRAEKVSLDQFVHLALLLKATDKLRPSP